MLSDNYYMSEHSFKMDVNSKVFYLRPIIKNVCGYQIQGLIKTSNVGTYVVSDRVKSAELSRLSYTRPTVDGIEDTTVFLQHIEMSTERFNCPVVIGNIHVDLERIDFQLVDTLGAAVSDVSLTNNPVHILVGLIQPRSICK